MNRKRHRPRHASEERERLAQEARAEQRSALRELLDDLLVGRSSEGRAWLPVVQAKTAEEAIRVVEGVHEDAGPWKVIGVRTMAPVFDDYYWSTEPWWAYADLGYPGNLDLELAVEMWELVHLESEFFIDIELGDFVPNPHYKGRRTPPTEGLY